MISAASIYIKKLKLYTDAIKLWFIIMIFYINYTFLPLCLLADLFLEFGQETCLNTRQQTMMIQTVTKPRTPAPMIIHMPPPNIDPLFLLSSFKKLKKCKREWSTRANIQIHVYQDSTRSRWTRLSEAKIIKIITNIR